MTISFEQRKRDFWDWHKANPRVWDYFERFSLEVVNKGHKKVSHWLIINRIRWEVYLETTGEEFKIDRKSTRLNSSHRSLSRMPSSA